MSILLHIFNLTTKVRYNFYLHWNRFKFKFKNVKLGKNFKITSQMYLKVSPNSSITIGENFNFTSDECFNPLCRNIRGCIVSEPNAEIIIGNNVGMSSPCIWSHKSIKIGNNVKIGGDCIIMDSDAHCLDFLKRRTSTIDQANKIDIPIIIEDDVLIGTRCIVLKGVTIGERSIIGSGSVVTKSIPANCIAAGNPCKVIKSILKP